MLGLLDRHRVLAILLAVLLEELGIPMPIPTDLLIVFAGIGRANSLFQLLLIFIGLTIVSTIGASGLYAIVRRGGRPLVDRFGRYVHLGPAQLARSEALLQRGGWSAIAFGRAVPGLRYVTVIACGLLDVPYQRFVTAHIVGSSVYIGIFLVLGAIFGPTIIHYLHLPELWLRLLWTAGLSLGLTIVVIWCCYRAHAQWPAEPSRRRMLGSVLLASFAGTTSLAAAWSATATVSELLGAPRPLNVTLTLTGWLLARGLRAVSASMLVYTNLLLLCVGVGALYYEIILPRLAPRGTSLPRQVFGLFLLGIGLVSSFLASTLLIGRGTSLGRWWQAGGPLLLVALGFGILCYALTTVYGRALAIAVLPSLRRDTVQPVPPSTHEPAPHEGAIAYPETLKPQG